MRKNIDIIKLAEIAIKAAIQAGKKILDVYYNSEFDVEFKSDNSPLTVADRKANDIIGEELGHTMIPVLSEEGKTIPYNKRVNWDLFWLVDPLDGTKEFINRNDEFTVNIALIKDNSPIAGVVFAPVQKTLYWSNGERAFKAFVDLETGELQDIQKLPLVVKSSNFVIVGSRSHMNAETETFIKSIDTKGKPVQLMSKGSSLKICMVAEGNADIYPRLAPTMEWDTAAGHAIAKYAGKEIFQFQTEKPLVYNKENLVNPWFVVQ